VVTPMMIPGPDPKPAPRQHVLVIMGGQVPVPEAGIAHNMGEHDGAPWVPIHATTAGNGNAEITGKDTNTIKRSHGNIPISKAHTQRKRQAWCGQARGRTTTADTKAPPRQVPCVAIRPGPTDHAGTKISTSAGNGMATRDNPLMNKGEIRRKGRQNDDHRRDGENRGGGDATGEPGKTP